jgi:hypothetical protein
MINPISSNSVTPYNPAPGRTPAATSQQPAKNPPQDSVQLSSQATGDVDHDGDSH